MTNDLLYHINEAIAALTESLEAGEIDQQAYIDTVENLGGENAIEDVVKSILNLEAEAEAVKAAKIALDSKQKRAEAAADSLRQIVVKFMDLTNAPKLNAGIFKVTKGSTASVDLLYEDMENYPAEYLIPQKPRLDKRKLLADMKNGAQVDGAVLKTTNFIKIK